MIEVVARDTGGKHAFELTAAELRETIAKIDPRNPARGLLLSLADRADAQVGQLGQRVADWYETDPLEDALRGAVRPGADLTRLL